MGVDCMGGSFERSGDGFVVWKGCGEAGADQTAVSPGEEQSGAETGVGHVVAVAVWQALDHAVEAQAAELVSHGALTQGVGSPAAGFGEMIAHVSAAKAVWQQAEENQGVP